VCVPLCDRLPHGRGSLILVRGTGVDQDPFVGEVRPFGPRGGDDESQDAPALIVRCATLNSALSAGSLVSRTIGPLGVPPWTPKWTRLESDFVAPSRVFG
jgi:hypothetical protein